jgi:hypothetical protein
LFINIQHGSFDDDAYLEYLLEEYERDQQELKLQQEEEETSKRALPSRFSSQSSASKKPRTSATGNHFPSFIILFFFSLK